MAKKTKAAPAEDEVLGPSPEEQAMADAEQRDIMARMKAKRDEDEKAERANHAGKLERAANRAKARTDLEAVVKSLVSVVADQERRIAALEAK